ncbi:hypothetical protein VNO80_02030 [Phaseolus coccineus]|uniref:Uncharacterized protein n=1 Tax=Phaseolus coccineus TaxID=3886 RepID=A0AAN9RTH3_PHACN
MDVIWQQQGLLPGIREFFNLVIKNPACLGFCWPVLYRNLPGHGVLHPTRKSKLWHFEFFDNINPKLMLDVCDCNAHPLSALFTAKVCPVAMKFGVQLVKNGFIGCFMRLFLCSSYIVIKYVVGNHMKPSLERVKEPFCPVQSCKMLQLKAARGT